MTKSIFSPVWERISAEARDYVALAGRSIAALKKNRRAMWLLRLAGRWAASILILMVYTLAIYRVAQRDALEVYRGWMEAYRVERMAIDQANAAADPYELQLQAEAESLARVLYGVKDNDGEDLRTMCWCVFNRVDNPAYPSTLEEVIAQPSQWMRYSADNPVLENLYQIAREQVEAWHSDAHRPCSADYVFMSWTPSDICLRDAWKEGSGTHYWRF